MLAQRTERDISLYIHSTLRKDNGILGMTLPLEEQAVCTALGERDLLTHHRLVSSRCCPHLVNPFFYIGVTDMFGLCS
jgi:hypothetical protein